MSPAANAYNYAYTNGNEDDCDGDSCNFSSTEIVLVRECSLNLVEAGQLLIAINCLVHDFDSVYNELMNLSDVHNNAITILKSNIKIR